MNILYLMNMILLPFMKKNTSEFEAFNYAVDFYYQGQKENLISQLNHLTASSNRNIAIGAEIVLKRARLVTF